MMHVPYGVPRPPVLHGHQALGALRHVNQLRSFAGLGALGQGWYFLNSNGNGNGEGNGAPSPTADPRVRTAVVVGVWTLSLGSGIVSAIHGYGRSGGQFGATVGWGLLGFIIPVLTPIVGLAQGFGQRSR